MFPNGKPLEHRDRMPERGAADSEFNFFCFQTCGHIWVVRKTVPPATT
jgi:hypothetical protein